MVQNLNMNFLEKRGTDCKGMERRRLRSNKLNQVLLDNLMKKCLK